MRARPGPRSRPPPWPLLLGLLTACLWLDGPLAAQVQEVPPPDTAQVVSPDTVPVDSTRLRVLQQLPTS